MNSRCEQENFASVAAGNFARDIAVGGGFGFAGLKAGHLYFWFASRPLIESGAAIFHAQAHFPT
jgi:hypothetical protein